MGLDDTQNQNARQVYEEVQELRQRYGVPLNQATVKRAFNRVFADRLLHESRSHKSKAVQKQSRQRMGTGSPTQGRMDVAWDGEAGDDPVIREFFNKSMQENGYR